MHRRRARKPLPGLRTCEIPVSARGMHHEPGYGQLVGRCSPMSTALLLRCKTQLLPTTQLMLRLQQVHAASSSPCRPSSVVQLCFRVCNSLWTQEQVNSGAGMPQTATNEFGKVYLSVTACIGLGTHHKTRNPNGSSKHWCRALQLFLKQMELSSSLYGLP